MHLGLPNVPRMLVYLREESNHPNIPSYDAVGLGEDMRGQHSVLLTRCGKLQYDYHREYMSTLKQEYKLYFQLVFIH